MQELFQVPIQLKKGDRAPDFMGQTLSGSLHFSRCYEGKWVGLFHAMTPLKGKTQTLIHLLQRYLHLNHQGMHLIAVSEEKNQALGGWMNLTQILINKELPFSIVYDHYDRILKRYGFKNAHQSGQQFFYLIDPEGIIREVFYAPDNQHFDYHLILKQLESLKQAC